MNKKEIYALLSTRNIWYEVTEHKAVYNMAEVAEIRLPTRRPMPKTSSFGTTKSAITISSRSKETSGLT